MDLCTNACGRDEFTKLKHTLNRISLVSWVRMMGCGLRSKPLFLFAWEGVSINYGVMLPMTACSLLLGRPWHSNRSVIHHGMDNVYSMLMEGERIRLKP